MSTTSIRTRILLQIPAKYIKRKQKPFKTRVTAACSAVTQGAYTHDQNQVANIVDQFYLLNLFVRNSRQTQQLL